MKILTHVYIDCKWVWMWLDATTRASLRHISSFIGDCVQKVTWNPPSPGAPPYPPVWESSPPGISPTIPPILTPIHPPLQPWIPAVEQPYLLPVPQPFVPSSALPVPFPLVENTPLLPPFFPLPPETVATVVEPSTLLLLAVGIFCLTLLWVWGKVKD